jgi:hypothetical protein
MIGMFFIYVVGKRIFTQYAVCLVKALRKSGKEERSWRKIAIFGA